jgi:DNA-directed RNA polymerase specialized sigma24 family protein
MDHRVAKERTSLRRWPTRETRGADSMGRLRELVAGARACRADAIEGLYRLGEKPFFDGLARISVPGARGRAKRLGEEEKRDVYHCFWLRAMVDGFAAFDRSASFDALPAALAKTAFGFGRNWLRSHRSDRQKLAGRRSEKHVDEVEAPPDDPDSGALPPAFTTVLRMMMRLPERQWAAVASKYIFKCPDWQIAARLKCSTRMVRKYRARAIAALKAKARKE